MQCLKKGFHNQINTHSSTERFSVQFIKTSFRPLLEKMIKDIESNKIDKVIFPEKGCNMSELEDLSMEAII